MALPPDQQPATPKKPTREDAEQDGFLREVDEAVRQDQMQQAAKKYGLPVAIAALVVIVGTGGYMLYHNKQLSAAEERTERLTLALDRIEGQNPDSANELLGPLAEGEGDGTAAMAALTQAGILAAQGDSKKAAAAYAAIAANSDAPQEMRDLATIREVSIKFDEMKPADVISRLKPLAVASNPWFGSAGELVAIAYLKQNKPDLAGPILADISRDEDVPQTLRNRAQQMAGLLGVDAIDDVEKALDQSQLAARGRDQASEQ